MDARRRTRIPFTLLVLVPAILLVVGGTIALFRSRADLAPELHRSVARRAIALIDARRSFLRDSLAGQSASALERPPARPGLRLTVHDSAGDLVRRTAGRARTDTLVRTSRARAMRETALRGRVAVDLFSIERAAEWVAYVPVAGGFAVARWPASASWMRDIRGRVGYDLTLYLDGRRALPEAADLPASLPSSVLEALASRDRPFEIASEAGDLTLGPLRDFDDWDLIGAVAVRPGGPVDELPSVPLAPLAGLLVAAVLGAGGAWHLGRHLQESPGRRGTLRLAVALLPPAVAAGWLAFSDARISATTTDVLLSTGARAVTAAYETRAVAAPDRMAALADADVAVIRGDSVVGASHPRYEDGAWPRSVSGQGRIRIGDRRRAYHTVRLEGRTRVTLFRVPLEDARKGVLLWMAGLFGTLVVGTLIFASVARAADGAFAFRETATAWGFVAPSLLLLLVFSVGPVLFALYLSFHEWNLLEAAKPFVGLGQYARLAGDDLFWNAVLNTCIYSLYVPVSMGCALAVALLLNRSGRGVVVLRAIFFLPYITSFVAISILWRWMYDPTFGLLNWILGLVGLGPFQWLNHPTTALPTLMLMAVWIHVGFQMVIFLAGLQVIPEELYEAAVIDGANAWQRFWRITLPMLRPTTFFVLVTSIIGSFQVFTFVYVMTEGGPARATDVIVYHIYQAAWQFLEMGYASAMSWVLFAVILAITLIQFRLSGGRVQPT